MARKKTPIHEWGPWEEWKNNWARRHCVHCGESDLARIPIICEIR